MESDSEEDDGEEKGIIVNSEERNRKNRKWLVLVTALYIPLYAGAFFGWGPMQLMLEENGAFEERCKDDEALPCSSQTARLLNVQLVALLTMIFAPLYGILSDTHGAVALMWFCAGSGCLGLTLLTIASALGADNLLFFTFVLLGFMAVSASILIVETGLVFLGKTRQRVISVLNTLYDAGALVYLALWGIKEATGAALQVIAGVYLGSALLCFAFAVHFWRVVVPDTDGSLRDGAFHDNVGVAESTMRMDSQATTSDMPVEPASSPGSNQEVLAMEKDSSAIEQDACGESDKETTEEERETVSSQIPIDTNGYVLISERPAVQQFLSKQFILLVVFFAFFGARNVFTLTTARDFLAYLGDDDTGNKYLTIFTLLTPASIAGLPFMDWIVNHYGYHAALQSINFLALLHGTIQVSSENLNVQVLGFIVFSFFRCFLFSIVFSFLPTFMGLPVVGRAAGIMTCAFGAFSFINIPLANLAVNQFDGNFFWPNLFYTVAVVPFVYVAFCMGQGIQKEEKAKTMESPNNATESADGPIG